MNYSIRNLVIAGGLAIAAIVAVLIYTSNVQQAAKEGQARVKVMVARVDIPAGTPAKDILARGDLIQQEIVQDDQLPGVLTTTDGLNGNVLKQDLYTGQQVSSQVFVPASEAASTVAIRGTTRAVGVDVKTSNGLVGTLKDGDHVDVYAEIGGGNSRIVRKVLTNVLVLHAQLGVKDRLGVLSVEFGDLPSLILRLQRELFVAAAELATNPDAWDRLEDGRTRVSAEMVALVEGLLRDLEGHVEMPREFVVPGETPTSAALELARTILRRAERRAVALGREGLIPGPHLLPYLNRLADLLWVLARAAEQAESRSATPSRTDRRRASVAGATTKE
jgi:ATP:cob(I)alamin adenosyltransferase